MGLSKEDTDRLARIQHRFAEFAKEYADLPLYAALCRRLAVDEELARLLLAALPGQARPVMWLAAVHDLVLRHPGSAAAQWYSRSRAQNLDGEDDPWPDVRTFVLANVVELEGVMARRRTQTNEVNRAVHLGVALAAAAADLPEAPVALVELGASAGLLLGIDRYAVELVSPTGSVVLGDPSSPVRCSGTDRSGVGAQLRHRELSLPTVVARVGVDLEPVSLDDDEEMRWLEACLWPDVPGRVERFRAARALLRPAPPRVLEGDMVRLLPQAVASALGDAASVVAPAHVVVLSSWALSYLTPEGRETMGDVVRDAAQALHALSWVTAEPPGSAPGIHTAQGGPREDAGTIVGLRRWRDGVEQAAVRLGSCHPHGQWVDLDLGLDLPASNACHTQP